MLTVQKHYIGGDCMYTQEEVDQIIAEGKYDLSVKDEEISKLKEYIKWINSKVDDLFDGEDLEYNDILYLKASKIWNLVDEIDTKNILGDRDEDG
jgi:uncharacterized protein (DUF2344 family)